MGGFGLLGLMTIKAKGTAQTVMGKSPTSLEGEASLKNRKSQNLESANLRPDSTPQLGIAV